VYPGEPKGGIYWLGRVSDLQLVRLKKMWASRAYTRTISFNASMRVYAWQDMPISTRSHLRECTSELTGVAVSRLVFPDKGYNTGPWFLEAPSGATSHRHRDVTGPDTVSYHVARTLLISMLGTTILRIFNEPFVSCRDTEYCDLELTEGECVIYKDSRIYQMCVSRVDRMVIYITFLEKVILYIYIYIYVMRMYT